jgi:hypothetical protein
MKLCLIKPTHVLLNTEYCHECSDSKYEICMYKYKILQKYFYCILNHYSFSPIKTPIHLCIISWNCFIQQLPFTYFRFLIALANQWYELKCIWNIKIWSTIMPISLRSDIHISKSILLVFYFSTNSPISVKQNICIEFKILKWHTSVHLREWNIKEWNSAKSNSTVFYYKKIN